MSSMGIINYCSSEDKEKESQRSRASDSKSDEAHIFRLEQILGKTRRASDKIADDILPGQGRFDTTNVETRKVATHQLLEKASHTQLESGNHIRTDGFINGLGKNISICGNICCDDMDLENAMKELMEATHDALVHMKSEILRMQFDLERALVEISLLRQREELLQNQFQDKALDLEREFMGRIEDLQQSMILEFTLCKKENEHTMLSRLESLLDQRREIQKKGEEKYSQSKVSLHNSMSISNQIPKSKTRSCCIANTLEYTFGNGNSSNQGKLKVKKPNNSAVRNQQQAALTEEMLRRISQQRLERSVATVRGWLQSPTPSESSSATCYLQKRLSNLPMPNLVDSFKEEAKLYATHRRAISSSHTKPSELSSDIRQIAGASYSKVVTDSSSSSASPPDSSARTSSEPCSPSGKSVSPVSVLDGGVRNFKESMAKTVSHTAHERISGTNSCVQSENGAHMEDQLSLVQNFTVENRPSSLGTQMREKAPALRILKRGNFKIADFLVSDSEEDVTL